MKLNVELSPKSIQEAIEKLKKAKYQSTKGTLIKEYLEFVCEWVINRANWYIDNADIGENVKIDIRNGWEYEVSLEGAKIINRTDQAVFVEFGVGIIGQSNKHANSTTEGYEYNKPSRYKNRDNSWIFAVDSDIDIDIQSKYIINRTENTVRTQGSPSVMYAYNAIVDARNELKKPNGVFAQEYKKLLERYVR